MKSILNHAIRRALSPEFRGNTKRMLRKLSSVTLGRELTQEEFRFVLENKLGIRKGCTVLIHCSFGRLKASFSPSDAIGILKDIVGEGGNIVMPCYPGNGDEWLSSKNTFDARKTPIATGALAQNFVQSSGVKMSIHPIKAVAAWGKDRDFLIGAHHLSRTPFDGNSPYARFLSLKNSLAVGLGTVKMSFYHCCEDSVENYAKHIYSPEPVVGLCRIASGEVVEVLTYVHRTEVLRRMPSSLEFLTQTACPGYSVISYRRRTFYVGDVHSIYRHVRQELSATVRTGSCEYS